MQTPPTWSTYPIKSENEIEIKIKIEDSTEWSMASMESENKKTNQFFKKQHKIKTYTFNPLSWSNLKLLKNSTKLQ
jgi:hypothetical protein